MKISCVLAGSGGSTLNLTRFVLHSTLKSTEQDSTTERTQEACAESGHLACIMFEVEGADTDIEDPLRRSIRFVGIHCDVLVHSNAPLNLE